MTAARRAALVGLGLVILAVALIRAPSVRVPILNEDEALYATTAASMAEGQPIYRAGVESKPPGIFYLYEAGFAVVGRYAMRALHALTILWVLGTALLVGALARRAAPTPTTTGPPRVLTPAVLGALLYAGFVIVQEPAVLATQCELMYSLPLALAAWLIVRGCARSGELGVLALVGAGLLCGAATLIKPTAVSLPVAASAWLVLRRPLLRGPSAWLADVGRAVLVWLGFAGAWLAAAAYFAHLGVWDDLVYWAFRWTLGLYIPTGSAHSPWWTRFLAGFCVWAALIAILWVLGAVAVRGAARARAAASAVGERDAPDAPTQVIWLLAAWTAAATALTFLGGRFFDHYFPAVIPPLAALAAVGLVAKQGSRRWRRWVIFGCAPVLVCWVGVWEYPATMAMLGDDRKPYDEIAAYTFAHSAPTDRVFVWGYYPLIYVAADRLAGSRFVGCHYLTGYAAIGLGQNLPPEVEDGLGVPNGFPTLLADLEASRPVLFIDTSPGDLHHWRRYPLSRYPTLSAYVAAHYRLEATIQGADLYRRIPEPQP